MHQKQMEKHEFLFQLRVLCLELGLCAVNWGGVGAVSLIVQNEYTEMTPPNWVEFEERMSPMWALSLQAIPSQPAVSSQLNLN